MGKGQLLYSSIHVILASIYADVMPKSPAVRLALIWACCIMEVKFIGLTW